MRRLLRLSLDQDITIHFAGTQGPSHKIKSHFKTLGPDDLTCLTSIEIRKFTSGGILKASLTARGCPPLGLSLSDRLGQRASNTTGIEVFCVNRRTRLLAPGLVEATGVNTIESKLIDKLHYNGFSCGVVACHGQGDPPRFAFGPPQLH